MRVLRTEEKQMTGISINLEKVNNGYLLIDFGSSSVNSNGRYPKTTNNNLVGLLYKFFYNTNLDI